jgi:hypothetical protein
MLMLILVLLLLNQLSRFFGLFILDRYDKMRLGVANQVEVFVGL